MARAERIGWRVAVIAMLFVVSPLGPTPSALAAFLDPATASATFGTDTLAPPTNLSAGLCVTGFTASWTATTSTWRTGYEVQWKLSTSSTWNSATTTETSHTVSGLSLLNTYDVRVRAYYGATWKSTFAGPVNVFCTL
jgi:hypothetical protein